jgi:hypothetical protein
VNKKDLTDVLNSFVVMKTLDGGKIEYEEDGNFIYVYNVDKIPLYIDPNIVLDKNEYRRKLMALYFTKNRIVVQLELMMEQHRKIIKDIMKLNNDLQDYINWDYERLPDLYMNHQFVVYDSNIAYKLLTSLLKLQLNLDEVV